MPEAEKYWLVHSSYTHQKRCNSHAEVKEELRRILTPEKEGTATNRAYVTEVRKNVDVTAVYLSELDVIDEYWNEE